MRGSGWPTSAGPSVSPPRNWSKVRSTSSPDGSRFQAWRSRGSPSRGSTVAIRISPPSSSRTTSAVTAHWPRDGFAGLHSSGSSEVSRDQAARSASSSSDVTLLEGFEDPLAVASAEGQALVADAEDRVIVVGARAVDDLDQVEPGGLGAALGGVDAARGGLERVAIPAVVLGMGGREVAVYVSEAAVEVPLPGRHPPARGDGAADGEDQEHDQHDDEPGGHGSITSGKPVADLGEHRARVEMCPDLALDALERVVDRLAVAVDHLADHGVRVAVEVEREDARLEVREHRAQARDQ